MYEIAYTNAMFVMLSENIKYLSTLSNPGVNHNELCVEEILTFNMLPENTY